MKIVVIGGGTGLYTTLLGLRDHGASLTAAISGLPRAGLAREPKDQLGSLPRDDASLCLVALAPTVQENVVLRGLLDHRMESQGWRGAHFGAGLLQALEETRGSRQAALDAAGQLLGIRGRIAIALEAGATRAIPRAESAQAAIAGADMVVIAPGNLERDLMPVLCCPGMITALQRTTATKVVVTGIITADDPTDAATTSHQVRALAVLTGCQFDAVVASHPERLGERLLEVGAQWLGRRAEQAS